MRKWLTQSWNLSQVGDWNSVASNGTAQTRTHGPTHELLTAGGQNVTTDTKGNITLIPATLRPFGTALLSNWDFDNRLNTADVGNNGSIDVTYKFDALGRRVFRDDGMTGTVFVQAGQQTIADYTAGAAAASRPIAMCMPATLTNPCCSHSITIELECTTRI